MKKLTTILFIIFCANQLMAADMSYDRRLGKECIDSIKVTQKVPVNDQMINESIYPLFTKRNINGRDAGNFGGVMSNRTLNARGGVDLFTNYGSGVRAIQNGLVISKGHWYMGTHAITVQSENGNFVRYGFLDKSMVVNIGDNISKGQLIAVVGRTKRINAQARLRIEFYSGIISGRFTEAKKCINRRADVMNPDDFMARLEANLN